MKDFIYKVYKNKKWITLGLSILYLLLFCFPIQTVTKVIDKENLEFASYKLPFILQIASYWRNVPNVISTLSSISDKESYAYNEIACAFGTIVTSSILVFMCFLLAIIYLVRLFKDKKFQFVWSLVIAFLAMLINGISTSDELGVYEIHLYPTTYIFLALLVLDIVYLILERFYLHGGHEKLVQRQAERQAQKEAEYKQSPEYRIEQLEKQVQELQSQVKSDEERQ
ncbi:MAG: cell envelope integrity protein TolA [Clostridiales bacterium]|nr:cell envelope integrity protein TolA [Clostridiales bacterium]